METVGIAEVVNEVQSSEAPRLSDIQVVLFELSGIKYGVDVGQVQGVVNVMDITKVPKAPHYVEGVTNLRGEVLPVIDLGKRLGLPDREAEEFNMIVINRNNEAALCFMVDQVNTVMDISSEVIDVVPDVAKSGGDDSVFGVARQEDDLILLIDLLGLADSMNTSFLN